MSHLFSKVYKSSTRSLSLFLTFIFLSSTSIGPVPFENNFIQPKHLAAASTLAAPVQPDYVVASSAALADSPEQIQQIQKAIQAAISTLDDENENSAILIMHNAVAPFITPANIDQVAFLSCQALCEYFNLDSQRGNRFFEGLKSIFRSFAGQEMALIILMTSLVLFTPGCASLRGLFGPSRPETPFSDIGTAADDQDASRLTSFITGDPDALRRLAAAQQITFLLEQENDKKPSERTLGVIDILRNLTDRLSSETNASVRAEIIKALGITLKLTQSNTQVQQVRNEKIIQLRVLYFQNRIDIARYGTSPTEREQQEARANRVSENQAIEQALTFGGSPINFSTNVQFAIDQASQNNPNAQILQAVISYIQTELQGTTQNGNTTYNIQASDLAALTALFNTDTLSSETPGESFRVGSVSINKIERAAIIRVLGALRIQTSIPLLLGALDKSDTIKTEVLRALLAIGRVEGDTGRHNFGTYVETVVTHATAVLTANTSSAALKDLAAQILNLVRNAQVADALRSYLASQTDLSSLTSLIQTYAQSVILNKEAIKGNASKKSEHGQLLVRILGLAVNDATDARKLAAEALQQIEYSEAINTLLITEARTRSAIPTGTLDAGQTALKTKLESELAAINAALTGLGFSLNDYASLKTRALDAGAPADLRAAMLARIASNVNSFPATTDFSTDLGALIADGNPAIATGAIRIFDALELDRLSSSVQTAIFMKFGDSNHGIRQAALNLVHRKSDMLINQPAVADLINFARAQNDAEVSLRLNILAQAARRNDAQRGLVNTTAVKTALEALARDTNKSNELRDQAVLTLVLLEGASPQATRLTQLRDLARTGSTIRTQVEALITRTTWNVGQNSFYSLIQDKSGVALENFLNEQIPARLNNADLVTVLTFSIEQRSLQPTRLTLSDQIALTLAMFRLNNTSRLSFLTGQLSSSSVNEGQKTSILNALTGLLTNASVSEANKITIMNSLLAELSGSHITDAQKRTVRSAITAFLNQNTTTENIRRAALASTDETILRSALSGTFTTASLNELRALAPRVSNYELMALVAEKLVATGDRTQDTRNAVTELNQRFLRVQGVSNTDRTTYGTRLLRALYSLDTPQAPTNGNQNGGNIGRITDQTVAQIWKSSNGIVTEKVQQQIRSAIDLAEERLKSTEFTGRVGKTLAGIALRRFNEGIQVSAFRSRLLAKSSTPDKSSDLFLLGFGDAAEARIPLELFADETELGQITLARTITHEILEGAREEIKDKLEVADTDEAVHAQIILHVERKAFPEADENLPQAIKDILSALARRNEKLDAIDLNQLFSQGREKVNEQIDTKVLENAQDKEAIQQAILKSFSEEEVTPSERLAAHLILPADLRSPLTEEVLPVLDQDALIVLDSQVLETLTTIPEALEKAIRSGRVLFFGEPVEGLSEQAFVKSKSELENRAGDFKQVSQIVTLLTPPEMKAHFGEYGPGQIAGKQNFVAPLNPKYDLIVHLALANELIQVNFDLSKLTDAARLLFALEIESLQIEMGDMISILTALGETPVEIIRNGKELFNDRVLEETIQRIAA